jgi:acyl-CoA synthetase (AMP-forming)/AMP-acid ligase II
VFVTSYLATAWLGTVFVPLNFRRSATDITPYIDDCVNALGDGVVHHRTPQPGAI